MEYGISIIIPALNEEANLKKLLPYLRENNAGYVKEIIVVDGGSRTIPYKQPGHSELNALIHPKAGLSK